MGIDKQKIKDEIDPITLVSPTVEQIVAQAQARGMAASGGFPLESEKRYTVMMVELTAEADPETVSTAIAALDGTISSFFVGDHSTGATPEGKQWDANIRIRISMGNTTAKEPIA